MESTQDTAVHLAKAYALTEILPLRHGKVQEALADVAGRLDPSGLQLSLKEGALWVRDGRVEGGEEVLDLQRGLERCGLIGLHVGQALGAKGLGAFLDALRIASISGHLENLREMAAFRGTALKLRFAVSEAPVSELSQPAGAIFASALAGQAGGAESESTPAEPVPSAPVPPRPTPPQPEDTAAWDPPGADSGTTQTATEEPRLSPVEFQKGVALFLNGDLEQRRKWAGPLGTRADGVDVSQDPGLTLDIVLELLAAAEPTPDDPVRDVATRLVRPEVARELGRRLGDAHDEEERGTLLAAAKGVGRLVAPVFAEEMCTSEDRATRRALVHALTFLGDDAVQPVEALLDRGEWYVVRNAVTVLGAIGAPGTVARLERYLNHPDARVRREAVMAMAKLGGDQVGHLLIGGLVDGDADVRAAAIMVAGILKVSEAAPVLRSRLDEEPNEGVTIEAIRTLGKLGDPDAVPLIKRRAVPSFFVRPSRVLRMAAYRALAAIGTPDAVRVLEEAAGDRDPEIRTVVSQGLEAVAH